MIDLDTSKLSITYHTDDFEEFKELWSFGTSEKLQVFQSGDLCISSHYPEPILGHEDVSLICSLKGRSWDNTFEQPLRERFDGSEGEEYVEDSAYIDYTQELVIKILQPTYGDGSGVETVEVRMPISEIWSEYGYFEAK